MNHCLSPVLRKGQKYELSLAVKRNLKQRAKVKTYLAKLDPLIKIHSKIPGVFENSSPTTSKFN